MIRKAIEVLGVRMTIDLKRAIPVLSLMLLVLALAPPAAATSGTLFITSDTTLTEDHNGDIVIAADNVTLDCAGHTVDADPWLWAAILVNGRDDVTVRNCRATNGLNGIAVDGSSARTLVTGHEAFGNANAGIAAANAVDTRIVGNRATGNLNNGIGLFQVIGVQVESNFASSNEGTAGIAMLRSRGGAFRDNTTTQNVHKGFNITESSDNLISGNRSSGNAEHGFAVFESGGNRFEANSSRDNGWNGFDVQVSPETTWNHNEAVSNGDSGFVLGGGSNDASLERNAATGNAGRGFALDDVSRSLLKENVARDNGADGFNFVGGSENEFLANRLLGNAGYGVFLYDADGNAFLGNQATGNGSAFGGSDFDWNTFASNVVTGNGHGFDMTRASHNTFTLNVVTQNTEHGFKIFDDTDYNIFDQNRVRGNGGIGFLLYGGYDFNQDYQLQPPDHNTFSNNQIFANASGGLFLGWDSTQNLVQANLVLRNGETGIALDRAIDNTVTRNVSCGNAIWDASQDGGSGNVWTANAFCVTVGI